MFLVHAPWHNINVQNRSLANGGITHQKQQISARGEILRSTTSPKCHRYCPRHRKFWNGANLVGGLDLVRVGGHAPHDIGGFLDLIDVLKLTGNFVQRTDQLAAQLKQSLNSPTLWLSTLQFP